MRLADITTAVRERISDEDGVEAIAACAVDVVHEKAAEDLVISAWCRKVAADIRAGLTGIVRGMPRPPAEAGQETLWPNLEAERAHAAMRRWRAAYAGVVSRYPRVVETDDWLRDYVANGGSYVGTLLDTLRLSGASSDLLDYWAAAA